MKNKAQEAALSMISGAVETLAYYSRACEDANSMESILNNILKKRFEELNISSEEPKYGTSAADGSIGSVWLGRSNNPDYHCMDVNFCPGTELRKKVGYIQSVIGVVNLAKRTYGLSYRGHSEPEEMFSHLEIIMKDWGLGKSEFKRTEE